MCLWGGTPLGHFHSYSKVSHEVLKRCGHIPTCSTGDRRSKTESHTSRDSHLSQLGIEPGSCQLGQALLTLYSQSSHRASASQGHGLAQILLKED